MAARLLHVTSPLMTGSDVTGIGNDSNGGEVMRRRERRVTQVDGFGRVVR